MALDPDSPLGGIELDSPLGGTPCINMPLDSGEAAHRSRAQMDAMEDEELNGAEVIDGEAHLEILHG